MRHRVTKPRKPLPDGVCVEITMLCDIALHGAVSGSDDRQYVFVSEAMSMSWARKRAAVIAGIIGCPVVDNSQAEG